MASEAPPPGTGPTPGASLEDVPVLPRHVVMLLTLAMVWGSSFVVNKIGVENMPALPLTTLRLAVGAAALLAVALLAGGLPRDRRVWVYAFWIALVGNALPFFLVSWGVAGIPSGLAAILMAVMPLTTMVLSHFFTQGDRMRPRKLAGIALGFAGVVVLVGPTALAGLGDELAHQLATAGAAVCYALTVIITRNMPAAPLRQRAGAVQLLAFLQILPVCLWLAPPWHLTANLEAVAAAVYLGLFPTALATLVLFRLVSEQRPSFVAFQNYLVPVFGVAWGAALLGETLSLQAFAALAMILAGIFVANRAARRA